MVARGRRGARRLLLQALYQSQISGHDSGEILAQFTSRPGFDAADRDYFASMLEGILADRDALDEHISNAADRPVEQLDPVEHAVLWIGVMELRSVADIPVKVVINEAVELAKQFGAQDSHRYINAVLDAVAAETR
jgi:N utilization substance protein B